MPDFDAYASPLPKSSGNNVVLGKRENHIETSISCDQLNVSELDHKD
jgi:hypothetical protein